MDFSNYSVKDFVLDESFQKWVIDPDEETSSFWNDWMIKHQHKSESIEEARSVIQGIRCAIEKSIANDADEIWDRISQQINPSK